MGQSEQTKSLSNSVLYRRLLAYAQPYWFAFLISFVGFFIFAGAQVLAADILQLVVDAFDAGKSANNGLVSKTIGLIYGADYMTASSERLRYIIVIAFLSITALRGIGIFFGSYYILLVGRQVIHDLRCDVFEHMVRLPTNHYDQSPSGSMVSRITFNIEQIQGAVTNAVTISIREGLTVVGLLAYLIYTNWKLTLTFVLVAPFIALVVNYVSKRFRRLSGNLQNSMADVTHITTEVVNGHRDMRIYGAQDNESMRFRRASENNLKQTVKIGFTQSAFTPVVQFLVGSALAILIGLGLDPELANGMSSGQFVAFIGAAAMLAKPLRQLSDVLNIIQRGLAAAEDIFGEMDMPIEDNDGEQSLQSCKGQVEFKQVSFAYNDKSGPVLSDISFIAKPGQTIALVGSSGSGKSTIVSLLPRFFDVDAGSVLIDGTDIKSLRLDSLREQIALVSQQVTLFNDTVRNNIAYGRLANASDEQIRVAIDRANAAEFIDKLDHGLDTIVGDNGLMLSGGQRQRLAIARALLKDAPILILDEATSALDNESERLIQDALDHAIAGRTTFVVAHRLSTVENADKILVLESGKIIESGTHQELLDHDGRYAQLYNNQFEDD